MVTSYALLKADTCVERLLVGTAISAMVILSIFIAWGLIQGKYSMIWLYRF